MGDADSHAPLDPALTAEIERVGAADVVVGIATTGPGPAAPAVGAAIRAGLDAHFPGQPAVVIHVDHGPAEGAAPALSSVLGERLLHVRPAHGLQPDDGMAVWTAAVHTVLAAGRALDARVIVMLNADITSMTADWLGGLVEPVQKEACGLVLPVYQRSRYEGTLTHTLVVPLVRALFGRRLAHPLAEEFACSAEAADVLVKHEIWTHDLGQECAEVWLPGAIIEGGFPIAQSVLGLRTVSAPARPAPLGPTVGRVAGALFALAEEFEGAWLDVRGSTSVPTFGAIPEPLVSGPVVDTERMLTGFRQGVRDLLPIWERILAPENLGDVLALGDSAAPYHFPDRLWARVVYDFLLAYRTRIVYRSHVAQSLAPLYLGRAASLIVETRARPASAMAVVGDALGRAFEEEKPYLVDQWR